MDAIEKAGGVPEPESTAGLEGVTVEVARRMNPVEAKALAKEIFRVRGKRKDFERLRSPRAFSEILQGRVADRALVVAQREGKVVGYGLIALTALFDRLAFFKEIVVKGHAGMRKRGLGTRIFQEGMWWILSRGTSAVDKVDWVCFSDASFRGISPRIGRRFFFGQGSDNYLIKDVSTRRYHSSLEEVETFSADKFSEKYRAQYQERLGPAQREIIDAFLSQQGAQVATAQMDLTRIPIYVQSARMYQLVREHLRPMYPGVLFYPVLLPQTEAEWERFEWEGLGLILAEEGQKDSVPNPKGLPVREVVTKPEATAAKVMSDLDPMDLLAEIFRGPLGIPPEAYNLRAVLFTDAEGNARLILMCV